LGLSSGARPIATNAAIEGDATVRQEACQWPPQKYNCANIAGNHAGRAICASWMKTKEMFHVEHYWEIKEKTGDSRLSQKGRV